jgi:hypothetical protein
MDSLAVALLAALAMQAVSALPQYATPLDALQADAQLSTFLTMATTGGLTSALSDPLRQVAVRWFACLSSLAALDSCNTISTCPEWRTGHDVCAH